MESRLLDFILRLNTTDSFEAAWDVYSKELATLGISQSLYGYTDVPDGHRGHGDYLYLANYSEAFMQEYSDNRMAEHDVAFDWCERNDRPFEWGGQAYTYYTYTKEQKAVEEFSADHQIRYGFTIPLRLLHGNSQGGVGLSATGIDKKEFEIDIKPHFEYIQLVVHTFHMFVQKFPRFTEAKNEYDNVVGKLTANEVETLRWLTLGCSINEIAHKKIYKSVPMVNKYINQAKIKLNARNRDQLIAKAIILGLL